jgi:hypothetical protein
MVRFRRLCTLRVPHTSLCQVAVVWLADTVHQMLITRACTCDTRHSRGFV